MREHSLIKGYTIQCTTIIHGSFNFEFSIIW